MVMLVIVLTRFVTNCIIFLFFSQAARGLANLAAHDDSNNNNAAIGEVPRALETIIQLTRSRHGGVRQEAAGALWNLAYDENNRKLIAELGGVEASVLLLCFLFLSFFFHLFLCVCFSFITCVS